MTVFPSDKLRPVLNKKLFFFLTLLFSIAGIAGQILRVADYENSAPIVVPRFNPSAGEVNQQTNWSKYNKALELMTQENYGCMVRQAAARFDVDPVAIMGTIISDRTYNYDFKDTLGERLLKMKRGGIVDFQVRLADGRSLRLVDLLAEPQYAKCANGGRSNYAAWDCYAATWKQDARNSFGSAGEKITIQKAFFDPTGSGKTYGIAQMGVDRALMVADVVHQRSGLPLITVANVQMIYDHILNPQFAIQYLAASLLISQELYKEYANMDISWNPGILATLFNVGAEKSRARALHKNNVESLEKGQGLIYPKTNHLGTLINFKQDEIRAAYRAKVQMLPASVCQKYTVN